MTVAEQIGEVLQGHFGLGGAVAQERILEILNQVGIPDAARRMHEYPFQFSGGMKQRMMIAMALAGEPELLIADEPTTALDVTIQAQVLELMRGLQERNGMSILLITHDLAVAAETAHQIGIMYAGEIVETAPRDVFFRGPAHPYSRKLLASVPGRFSAAQRDPALSNPGERCLRTPQIAGAGCGAAIRPGLCYRLLRMVYATDGRKPDAIA
jgi:peptide/nickel transport system ATP-binding protein